MLVLLALACQKDVLDTAAEDLQPALGEQLQVVPGDGLPADLDVLDANNNLDVVVHEGEVFFAFRTAPDHFANSEVYLHVLRSSDQETWTHEVSFFRGTDLREPRFLSWNGELFLYFAELGTDPLDFEPHGTLVSVRGADGQWSEAEWIFEDTFIPWRARVVDGVPMMMGYTGGEDVYDLDGLPAIAIKWLTTEDGWTWDALVPGAPVVLTGGGSEADFAFTPDGAVVAVVRNEAGDELGWGSKICRGEADDLADWRCEADPRKYDSPLVFEHGGRIWLVGRRNVTDDGAYDLGMRDLDHADQTLLYNATYWQEPKRCSLWEVNAAWTMCSSRSRASTPRRRTAWAVTSAGSRRR
ncbi:MAG: hypothetical protein AAF439_03040 [Pseudomonadota bacterium]